MSPVHLDGTAEIGEDLGRVERRPAMRHLLRRVRERQREAPHAGEHRIRLVEHDGMGHDNCIHPVGPGRWHGSGYSQAVRADTIYVAGPIGLDVTTGELPGILVSIAMVAVLDAPQ